MLGIDIDGDRIRVGGHFSVSFYRTLRVPDDGNTYPLPPGLGRFPLFRVDAYRRSLPPEIAEQGGVFIPMYQREALWMGFQAASWKPSAVIVATGGINAVSGAPDTGELRADPQNYLVCPDQPWLDGIHSGRGTIRQFVAMPLGLGYSVEASLTGAETGGIQVSVFAPRPGLFPDTEPPRPDVPARAAGLGKGVRMGLGAGGAIRQKIYPDPYGIDTWDTANAARLHVHLVNSARFREITGLPLPPTPIDAKVYTEHGLPWFDLYDEAKADVAPTTTFSAVKSIAERDKERGEHDRGNRSFDIPPSQIDRLNAGKPAAGAAKENAETNRRDSAAGTIEENKND